MKTVVVYSLQKPSHEIMFTNVSPRYAVQYIRAESDKLLSWFFKATQEQRDARLKCTEGKFSISCGNWVARK
jgi:hypothetical protein